MSRLRTDTQTDRQTLESRAVFCFGRIRNITLMRLISGVKFKDLKRLRGTIITLISTWMRVANRNDVNLHLHPKSLPRGRSWKNSMTHKAINGKRTWIQQKMCLIKSLCSPPTCFVPTLPQKAPVQKCNLRPFFWVWVVWSLQFDPFFIGLIFLFLLFYVLFNDIRVVVQFLNFLFVQGYKKVFRLCLGENGSKDEKKNSFHLKKTTISLKTIWTLQDCKRAIWTLCIQRLPE